MSLQGKGFLILVMKTNQLSSPKTIIKFLTVLVQS